MLLSGILEEARRRYPSRQAVACRETKYSYSMLHERSSGLAAGLRKKGLRFPDRIAIVHRNCHCFLESYLGAAKAGLVLVPINYRLSSRELTYVLENSGSKAVIVEDSLLERTMPSIEGRVGLDPVIVTGEVSEADIPENAVGYEDMIETKHSTEPPKQDVGDEEPAHLYYTSGTTGTPKGVVLTHRNNYLHAVNTVEEIRLSEEDRWLHASPMYHLADAWSTWAITMAGGTHIFVPEFEVERVLDTIEKERATVSNFIPTMLNMIVNHPNVGSYDLTSFRLVMSGGAPIAPEVIKKVIETFGCEYIQTYGLTETSPYLTMSILKDHLKSLPFEKRLRYLATAGRPFKDVSLKVVKEDGTEVKRNGEDVGEIVAKGNTITPGYWELPEETKKRIVDGWLHTRDLATVDEEGYVTIVDRMDDMIITGGENVYSIEVENVLYGHPKVSEAAVIGLEDETWGERIVAVVVPKEGERPSQEEIIQFCRRELASFKTPKQVIFAEDIPKTTSGKTRKNDLRKKYRG